MDTRLLVERIRIAAKRNGKKISEVEDAIGISRGAVSRWINSPPLIDKIFAASNYLNVSPSWLLNWKPSSSIEIITNDYSSPATERIISDTRNKYIEWMITTNNTVPEGLTDFFNDKFTDFYAWVASAGKGFFALVIEFDEDDKSVSVVLYVMADCYCYPTPISIDSSEISGLIKAIVDRNIWRRYSQIRSAQFVNQYGAETCE